MKKHAAEAAKPGFKAQPWGYELIIADGAYGGKKLVVANGQNIPLHYHLTQDKTIFIQRGCGVIYYCDDPKSIPAPGKDGAFNPEAYLVLREVKLNEGDVFYLPPGRVHQIFAYQDLEIIEISTKHHKDDTIQCYS